MPIPHFPFSAHAIAVPLLFQNSPSKTELIFQEKMFHNSCGTEIRTNKIRHPTKLILKNV